MILMHRNLKTVYYALWKEKTAVTADGYETGEYEDVYETPVEMKVNISPERSYILTEAFGPMIPYERVIITSDMDCPVDESSVFWVDAPLTGPHDYFVRRVAKSLNHISITVRKCELSVSTSQT